MKNKKAGRRDDQYNVGVKRLGRTIYFFDEVTDETVCEAIFLIQVLESESLKKPIEVIICSGGGNAYEGFALYDKLRASECQIITIGSGIVASMAVILLLAGDERALTENTRLMNHQVSTYLEGRLEEAKVDVKETIMLEDMLLDIVSDRTGQSMKILKAERKTGDKYLSAEEAVNEGYAHKIIQNKRTIRRRRKKK